MKKITYTPEAADKLQAMKKAVSQQYGSDKAKEIMKEIMGVIRGLCENEKKGPEVSQMFDVDTDYRYLFIAKNDVFYRIEDRNIRVINLYHEKEDFMWQLFGIDTASQESMDYWEE